MPADSIDMKRENRTFLLDLPRAHIGWSAAYDGFEEGAAR